MRTVSCIIGGTLTREIFFVRRQCLHPEQSYRRLSTNSAINRGIRRGKSNGFRGDGRSQVDRGERSERESSTPRSDGRFSVDRGDRSGWKSSSYRGNGVPQIERGDSSRAESRMPRRDGQLQLDRGGKSRGEDSVSGRASRSLDFRGDSSERASSISRRDDYSQNDGGVRWGETSNTFKRDYRGGGHSRNETGNSISRSHAEPQSTPRHASRKFERFETSSYAKKRDIVHEPVKLPHRWMGRGSLSNRTPESRPARYGEEQLSTRDDTSVVGKRPSSGWGDKHSSSRTGKDTFPVRYDISEESRTARRSWQSLRTEDSGGEEEVAISRTGIRNRKPTLSIPYTTPASEFLYGTSVVLAALKSQRRKLYKLYVHDPSGHHGGLGPQEATDRPPGARKLALTAGIEVVPVKSDDLPLMDKMSDGRPHNGYILEASPLPKLPVTSLQSIKAPQSTFQVTLGHQSSEDEAINGLGNTIPSLGETERFPFVLLLDGILDPGNLGAILRTAYFLGVDAVAISTHRSAPLTPVALKASAGASENITLFSISKAEEFLEESSKNGWQVYAAVAPPSGTSARKGHFLATSTLNTPLDKSPTVLMLGGESEGLRYRLQKQAHHHIGIGGARAGLGGVDSLNVSVASALLTEAFLRPYTAAGRSPTQNGQLLEERLF